jgi:hypothetical protein
MANGLLAIEGDPVTARAVSQDRSRSDWRIPVKLAQELTPNLALQGSRNGGAALAVAAP